MKPYIRAVLLTCGVSFLSMGVGSPSIGLALAGGLLLGIYERMAEEYDA
tara:strand:+ start:1192 stop:1338 length:147 start_codon:yes stop_codon:yes gene_type:complete